MVFLLSSYPKLASEWQVNYKTKFLSVPLERGGLDVSLRDPRAVGAGEVACYRGVENKLLEKIKI